MLGKLVEPIQSAFAGDGVKCTFTHLRDADDGTGQIERLPVLLDERGVVTLAMVAGLDDEEAALSQAS